MIFRRLRSPIGDGYLYLYGSADANASLNATEAGHPETRQFRVTGELPDEKDLRAVERQLAATYAGRASRALAWGIWWLIAAPAVALLAVNLLPFLAGFFGWLPPLSAALATLGASSGGMALAIAVALAPLVWGWRHAARDIGRYRQLSRLARGARRRGQSAVRAEPDSAIAAFEQEVEPLLLRLRESLAALPERGADGAGEGAAQARQVALSAARHDLPEVADTYHALYDRLARAERSAPKGEGGVLAERRARGEAVKAQRAARALFAPYRLGARSGALPFAPLLGGVAGVGSLVLALALTGVYLVPDGAALYLEGTGARLGRLIRGGAAAPGESAVSALRGPAAGWSAPFPLTGRRYVSLEPRVISIFSRLRPVGDDAYDVVEVRISYRITDLDRWAALDVDEEGERRLTLVLSQQLDEFIGERRQVAAQQVAMENPALANNAQQLFARADQLVAQRLDEFIRFYVTQAAPQMAQGAGIQISPQYQAQPRQAVPASVIEAILGQER